MQRILDRLLIGGSGCRHPDCRPSLAQAQKAARQEKGLRSSGFIQNFLRQIFKAIQWHQLLCSGWWTSVQAKHLLHPRKERSGAEPLISVNLVATGLVADVGIAAESVRWMGPQRYDLCAVWMVLKRVFGTAQVVTDDGFSYQGKFLTAFANQTPHFGEGLRAAPGAKLDDGLLDLVLMTEGSRDEMLEIFQQLPTGAQQGHRRLLEKQCKSVRIEPAQASGLVNIDGEVVKYEGPIEIEVLPKSLRLFADPDTKALVGSKGKNPVDFI